MSEPPPPLPPSQLGRLRLRLRSAVREALLQDAKEEEDKDEEGQGPRWVAEEEDEGPDSDADVRPDESESDYSDMPQLELADPRSPDNPVAAPDFNPRAVLRNLGADAMLQWVAAIASRNNSGGRRGRVLAHPVEAGSLWSSRSHCPHASLIGISAGEMEEAVEHAYTELVGGVSAAWPVPADRPTNVQFRLLMDSGLVGQMVWYRNTFGGWPSDASLFAETLSAHLCPCYDGAYPVDLQLAGLAHLVLMGQAVRCRLLPYLMMYHLQEGRFPSYVEWSGFLDRFMAFERDPVQYYQDDRQHAPVRGLERLPVTAYASRCASGQDELQCTLCFEDLRPGQAVVVLPACGHTFHAQGPDCIGTTVLEWCMKEHTCPTCRAEVVLP